MARITRRKVENTAERMIVTGMVVSSDYMSQVAGVYDPSFLVAPFSKAVAGWCVDYYKTYNKVPGVHIKDIFDRHKDDPTIDDETMDTVESFLEGISTDYERADNFNVDFLVKETETYFRRRSLLNMMDRGRVALENGCDPAEAESMMAEYKSPLLTASQSVSILENLDWWGDEDEDVQTLFSYPGPLGELIGPVERDSFIALLAPEKRGKCIRGDQLISMSDGSSKKMVNVVHDKDHTVLGLDVGTLKMIPMSVVEHVCNGKKHCYRLTTKTGRSVVVTDNEPFLTPHGWVELADLKVGDRVAAPKCLPFFGSSDLTESQLKVAAYVIAEGGLTQNSVRFTSSYADVQNDFAHHVRSLGSNVVNVDDITVLVIGKGKGIRGGNPVLNFIRNLGLLGLGSRQKCIPGAIMRCSKEQLACFLNTLFTCDGSVYQNHSKKLEVEWSSASEVMANQVQALLTKFGIVTKLRKKLALLNGKRFPHWVVSIRSAYDVWKFLTDIGFSFHKKREMPIPQKRSLLDTIPVEFLSDIQREISDIPMGSGERSCLREAVKAGRGMSHKSVGEIYDQTGSLIAKKCLNSDVLWDYVVSISYEGMSETYDLVVAEHHNYIASGIIVHNTNILLDASMRCIRAGFNAAVFQVGDLTEKQAKARYRSILTGHSVRLLRKKNIYVPMLDCEHNQTCACPTGRCPDNEKMYDAFLKKSKKKKSESEDDDPRMWKPERFLDSFPDHKPCSICAHGKERQTFFKGAPWWVETPTETIKARSLKDELEKAKRRRWGHLELFVRPADSFTIEDMDRALMIFQHQRGITFDMIVVDYADIVKASNEKDEFRHRENKKWMAMRGLSQKWNASLWTGTQARKNDKENMDTEEMAEDKRKMAHVTSFLAMNQTKIEKARGILRLAQFLARDDDFDAMKNVHVLQSVITGRPIIASYW